MSATLLWTTAGQRRDFLEIARRAGIDAAARPSIWPRNGIVICPISVRAPKASQVFCGRPMGKLEECRRMADAGVPVPRTEAILPGTRLDPQDWGDRVVVKPASLLQGRGLTIEATETVRWRDPGSWPKDDPRHGQQMIAQAFIDTGSPVQATRALTFFGKVIYAVEITATDPDHVAAMSAGQTWRRDDDPRIDGLAAAVYAAIPEVPIHALDILRDRDGQLHVCEMNARGLTWHLSSARGVRRQREVGFDLYAEFDPLARAAAAIKGRFA